MNHQIPKTQTIIEAVRTRQERLKNNAFEFFGISLWHNWDTESWKNLSLLEQLIGQQLRTEVHVFSDSALCAGNKNAFPNQTWATRLSELWESSTFMDKYDISSRPVQFLAQIFRSHSDPNQERNSNILGIHGAVWFQRTNHIRVHVQRY